MIEEENYKIEDLTWENVIILSAFLGKEDRGILTASISCQGEVWNQSFGGRVLDEPGAFKNFLVGTMAACEVESWEQLKGRSIRIGRLPSRVGFILAIRPLINSWPVFMPTVDLAKDPCLHVGYQESSDD